MAWLVVHPQEFVCGHTLQEHLHLGPHAWPRRFLFLCLVAPCSSHNAQLPGCFRRQALTRMVFWLKIAVLHLKNTVVDIYFRLVGRAKI